MILLSIELGGMVGGVYSFGLDWIERFCPGLEQPKLPPDETGGCYSVRDCL